MTLNRNIAPNFHQIKKIDFLNVKKHILDNGIELNSINGGSQEIIKLDFIFSAGIWHEKKPLTASSTNKLIKEGTQSYTAYEIAEGIDNYGAFLEVENGFDSSTVTLYTLNKHLNQVLPFVKEVICQPKLSENEFDIHKNNSIECYKINLEKVSFVARKEFSSLIFGHDHPYENNPNIDNYNSLTINNIREFHHNYYGLNNCKILISGKVTNEIISTLNTFFGTEKVSHKATESLSKIESKSIKKNIYVEKKNALQSAIRIGRLMPNKLHPDYFGLKVFNTILGGYFGSRLMSNIREDKGYTYGIGSGLISLKNSGYFFISTEVGTNVTKDALTEIYKELELMLNEEVSNEELDLVRNYMLGQFLKSCDGSFNMANLFESANSYGLDYSFYQNYIDTIKTITPKTIMELGVKYFNKSELKEVVVGKI
jgi:zinc protease